MSGVGSLLNRPRAAALIEVSKLAFVQLKPDCGCFPRAQGDPAEAFQEEGRPVDLACRKPDIKLYDLVAGPLARIGHFGFETGPALQYRFSRRAIGKG